MDFLLTPPLGALLARPWVDRFGLFCLRRWYFPLSRLWAAANAAGDDVAHFRAGIGAPLPAFWPAWYLRLLLRLNRRARALSQTARQRWEAAIFAGDAEDPARLDRRRRWTATLHLSTRALFYPLLFGFRPPVARWTIPAPAAVEVDLADLGATPLDTATVEMSKPSERAGLRHYWLRTPTPAARLRKWPGSETLYARVVEPADAPATATLILGSGLCLETDLQVFARDAGRRLAPLGWRLVEPVSPFHGLRSALDLYGGEAFFAFAPAATVDLIVGQTIESALLIAWCRERFGGPVALGGISMTSFVAQLAASHCHLWPAPARPDGVLLISHSGRIEDVTFGGELTVALGLEEPLNKAGWSRADLSRLSAHLDPSETPALPAERIVSVLGETDGWLPYKDGLEVVRRWKLPAANAFAYPLGHLGMPVQLARDLAPYERLRQVLQRP